MSGATGAAPPVVVGRRWAFRIGRLAGIDVYVHATLLALLVWLGVSQARGARGAADGAAAVGLMVVVFGVIVLHELGHALAARRYGIGTTDITLYPIGGVGTLERLPERPAQELVVALAGPAVNVALALVALVLLVALDGLGDLSAARVVGGPMLARFLWLNAGLAAFNLLPAFPMDGGRVFRAILSRRLGRVRATEWAVRVGRVVAVLFVALGLFGDPVLLLIALFVWMSANREIVDVRAHAALDGVTVAQATMTDVRVLSAEEPVESAVAWALAGAQDDFPVVEGGRLVGMVSRRELLESHDASVGQAMHRDVEPAEVDEPLLAALARVAALGVGALPVTRHGRLVGVLTPARVVDLLRARELAAPT